MPKWLSAVIGAAEIAGGIALDVFAGGAGGFGNMLISLGIGTEISGIGTLLSKGPMQGGSTSLRNPIGPREIVYGQVATGGNLIYVNQFGTNNKYVDMVFDLADFGESRYVTGLMIDRQVVQLDTTAVPAGVPASTYPQINGGMSFTPLQQKGMGIYWIERISGVVTLITDGSDGGTDWGDIPLLVPGSFITVDSVPSGDGHNPGDSTVNGTYKVTSVTHYSSSDPRFPTPSGYSGAQKTGTYCKIVYAAGGVDTAVFRAGHLSTKWPDYTKRIYMEVLTGGQSLGHTFVGLMNGTPDPANIHGGAAISYESQGNGATNPWTVNHSGVGCTLVHVRLYYDSQAMPFIPQISFLLSGRTDIFDPRTSTTGYSENAALCIAHFLTNKTYGYGMTLGVDIDTAALITAANVCDEGQPLAAGGTEPRYGLNGRFPLSMKRGEILQNMLTACAGRIRLGPNGYVIQAAKWAGPATAAPGMDHLLPYEWSPAPTISELYNGVKGTYVWPGNNWQSSDFPPYAQDTTHGYGTGTYSDQNVIADGGDRRWLDIQLPFTISPSAAQRIAKIELMRRRKFGTGTLRYNLFAYQFTALDIISETIPFLGWSGKELEVSHFRFLPDPQNGFTTELTVQETDVDIFDWAPATEELTPSGYTQPSVPSVLNTSVPTELTLRSDITTEFVETSGKSHSRILATWTPPADGYVLSGGHIEIQFQLDGAATWESLPSVDPNVTQTYISDVIDGDQYDVRIRSVNVAGIPSNWVQAGPVTVSSSQAGFFVRGPNGGNQYPVLNDALYPQAMFGLTPTGRTADDGSAVTGLVVAPVAPPRTFSSLITTPLLGTTIAYATGGSIPAGTTGYIAIAAIDSAGNFTNLSDIVQFAIPAGMSKMTITPTVDSSASLILIYTGNTAESLSYRRSNSVTGTITLSSLASVTGDSYAVPDANFDHFTIGTTIVLLAGIFGGTNTTTSTITAVVPSSGNHYQLTLSGAAFTPSALIGRVLSSIVQGTGNPTPLQNYTITANDATSVTVVAPPPGGWGGPVPSFAVGDQVFIPLKPTTYTGLTVGDSMLAMGSDDYKGKVLRVLYPDGTNQTQFISGNDGTTFTLVGAFNGPTPVFFWVEESSFSAMTPGPQADFSIDARSSNIDIFAPIANLANFVAAQVFATDAFGNLSVADYSPIRLGFWPGASGIGGTFDGYQIVTMDGSNNFNIDLSLGLNVRIVLDATTADGATPANTIATITPPTFTGGSIIAGMSFYLYVGQDSTGGWPLPNLSTDPGGFASNAYEMAKRISDVADLYTYIQFTYHGTSWSVDLVTPGISLT